MASAFYLGIDPGYGRLGYGIVASAKNSSRPSYVDSGVIETPSDLPEADRLLMIETELLPIIQKQPIEFCAIEQVFFRKNLTTGVQLIQARGVVLLCLAKHKIPYVAVSPTSLKKMVTGSGKADKKQIELIMKKLMGLEKIPGPDDAADGLSLALYAWLNARNSGKIKRI